MTLPDWLAGPDGHLFILAVVGLLNAVALYLMNQIRSHANRLERKLNSHLEQHVMDAVQKQSAEREPESRSP